MQVATELDTFEFGKYSEKERKEQRLEFLHSYMQDAPQPSKGAPPPPSSAAPTARVDLIPKVSERPM